MDSLGRRFIAAWLADENSDSLSVLKTEYIKDDAKEAWDWILEYRREYGENPSIRSVFEECGVELTEEKSPSKYMANLLRKRELGLGLSNSLKEAIEKLDTRDPDNALDILIKTTHHFARESAGAKIVSFKESGRDRLGAYDTLKLSGGMLGFPTPWDRLNKSIQGWVDGTLNVITAMQNTGKTWVAIICAEHALELGKKVLFVSLEMDIPRIQRRFDAVRYKLPFKDLRNCELTADEVIEWERRIVRDESIDGDILFADKRLVQTVAQVELLVHEFQPDIVFVDGGYRFQSQNKRDGSWEGSAKIVADLQIAAELSAIPWVVTTQQGDSAETDKVKKGAKKMHAWRVRYAKEWVINPDNVIGLYANEDLRLLKALEIHRLKTQNSTGDDGYSEFMIQWDLSRMNFEELLPVGGEAEGVLGTGHEVKI